MRGVKIGAKRGAGGMAGMSMFEMKEKKKAVDPVGGQL